MSQRTALLNNVYTTAKDTSFQLGLLCEALDLFFNHVDDPLGDIRLYLGDEGVRVMETLKGIFHDVDPNPDREEQLAAELNRPLTAEDIASRERVRQKIKIRMHELGHTWYTGGLTNDQ